MNKILNLIFLIASLGLASAEDLSTWGPAKMAADQMARGVLPSVLSDVAQAHYNVVMIDDKNIILGLQAKSGGLVFIYRSKNDKVLYKSGNVVVTVPVGHSTEKGDTRWSSAKLKLDDENISKHTIKILRKNEEVFDCVTLSKIAGNNSASWNFR